MRGEQIAENRKLALEKIREACLRVNRDPAEVRLIAVSKTRPLEDIQAAWEAGARDFGENYMQELREKMDSWAAVAGGEIRWHMIGHLQRNKVKYLVGRVAMIHSVDSLPLAWEIEKKAAAGGIRINILLEVNVAGEESKFGFSLAEVDEAAERITKEMPHLRLRGLMTSAPYTEDPETNRLHFQALRNQAMALMERGLIAPSEGGNPLPELSMGMSGDYEVAVEEGATLVRVGTCLFGERDYSAVRPS